MNEAAYHAATCPEKFSILGLRLKTFSLGHLILLHRIESPFVAGAEADYDDLGLAVLICSMRYRDADLALNSPLLRRMLHYMELRAFGKLNPLYWLGLRRARVIHLADSCYDFRRYMSVGHHVPHYHYDPTKIQEMQVPMVHAVRVAMIEMGIPETDLMDRGWPLCLLDYHVLKANAGAITLADKSADDEARRVAKLAEQMCNDGRIKIL